MSDEVIYIHTRNFPQWLIDNNCSILFTSYSAHKIYCVGTQANGDLSIAVTYMNRPMGLCVDPVTKTITCGGLSGLMTFVDIGDEENNNWGYFDTLWRPKSLDFIGDVDIHDCRLGYDEAESKKQRPKNPNNRSVQETKIPKIYAASVLFNSIITTDPIKSFKPVYTPHWITTNNLNQPPCEDRCHLNGLALVNGKPKYATASNARDYYQSWRHHTGEGVVIDVEIDKVITDNLHSPHSPNYYKGKLYIGEAGTGQFGYIDLQTYKFIPKKFIPGFIRGISIHNDYALVCTSGDRHDESFQGLPLHDLIKESGRPIFKGITILSLKTYDVLHQFELTDDVTEIYDIAIVPGVKRGRILDTNEVLSVYSI